AHERTGEAESLEADHEDHASIWPFGIGVGMFVTFLGLSGLTPYVADFATARGAELAGNTAGSENVLYPALSLVGVGILGVALFQYGREEFNAPEMAIAERWPFEGVGTTKTGVWFFLASDVVVFGAVIGAYVFMRIHGGWGTFETVPPSATIGLINTYVLLTSSFTVVIALVMAERGNKRGLLASMGVTLLLGLTFLAIKSYEWGQEFAHGIYWFTELQYSMYFVTTGLHALHVILGLLIAGFMIYRIVSVDAYLEDDRPVEYFGLYWHFVDIVWVILFPLFYLM
ncbi:cytochrome c oxidase subunit 3, partial [Natrinema soli]